MRGLLVAVLLVACGGGSSQTAHDCTDGETRTCYRGMPASSEGIGPCAAGVETCSGGTWPGVCAGDVTPFVETCNGIDDDCDGEIDNAEDSGAACMIGGCPGVRGCQGDEVRCIALPENECGLCGGPPVSGLGSECNNDVCTGVLVCSMDKQAPVCNAPGQNECELCGGPAVPNLGTVCMASAGCAGRLVCNPSGTSSLCDCGANLCNDAGTIRDIVAPAAGDLVITEVMPSPAQVSDTVGEWFEVRVMRDVDLNNLGLDRAGDTANPNVIRAYDCMHVTAGTTLVFARNTDPVMNGGLPAPTATFTFSLVAGSVTTPGDVRLLFGSIVVDAITWTSSRNGKALQLDPDVIDALGNDNASNFCDATTSYGAGDFGTPAAANVQCTALPPAGQCDDAGTFRAIVKPTAGQLVITELMPNPKLEPGQEWFEISNVGAAAFDLNGLGLDRAADTRAPDVVASAACKSLAPGGFALLARSADPATNGGLTTVDATFGFSLVNTNGDVRVVDPASCAATTPFACTTIYDSATYTTSTDGVSAQIKPMACAGTTPYGDGTNLGTPRATNICP